MAVWVCETSQQHPMRAITDSVTNNFQLKCAVKRFLLYRGSGHSQSFASCLSTCRCRRHVPDDYECH